MPNPKADCEALMNSMRPLAEQLLSTHGEFHPFGGAMRSDGEVVTIAGYDGSEHPVSAELIAVMKEAMVAAARNREYRATAIVYDARVELPASRERSDAIAVALDHRSNYSVVVFFPTRSMRENRFWALPSLRGVRRQYFRRKPAVGGEDL